MAQRILLVGFDDSNENLLRRYLQAEGYQVVAYGEPDYCPVFHGKDCPMPAACSALLMLNQYLGHGASLAYMRRLKHHCPGEMSRIALLAPILTPEDLMEMLGLGCKVIFTPIFEREIRGWLEERAAVAAPPAALPRLQ